MSLWDPKKALNQSPHFGRVGAVVAHASSVVSDAERIAINAQFDAQKGRRKRVSSSVFDRSTKGSR
jgi:hypothetical protein